MAERVAITTDYITLQQLLKIADLIRTGGMAKAYLAEQEVLVNGEEENRRGKKLYPGYTVETAGQVFEIDSESDVEANEREEKAAILARFQASQDKGSKKVAKNKPTGPSSWS
ncbi:S4 domain-containing protein YaaA [Fructobacillus sp. CRL 2054]|uniref:S4 domain-containing protein YaaA n=1 Tax=Fructobacillus sp. CRL 2054 TaxID=2763007 RepID=UPI002379AAAB|nr:S4 domain-containing protein YaaA [Fructobacillus sp. CRL 2054]MDD9138165.1 S4 domain-containing protein YaaA [Fructobacillus sp. CRL 2054]